LAAAVAVLVSACSGGGDGGPNCDLDNPAEFASSSPWPKFRRDRANTGTLPLSNASALANLIAPASNKQGRIFPEGDAKGAFSASPVISSDGTLVYIGSNDGVLYALDTTDWTQAIDFNVVAAEAITATALVAVRNGTDAIFAGSVDFRIYGVDSMSTPLKGEWPFSGGLSVDTGPNISLDGTIYSGSSAGAFFAVCPNGVGRFSYSLGDVSPAALGPDDIVYVGSDDRLLRAFENDGLTRWSLAVSQPISAAPVVDASGTTTHAIFVADLGGRIFKAAPSGLVIPGFHFAGGSPIRSSPALASGVLYFGSDDGKIHSISAMTGSERPGWPIQTGGPILSSPAVAELADQRVVVVGSDDGNVYFIHDDDSAAPSVTLYTIGSPVRSSPAIDFAGNVYVGSEDGRVYAIHSTAE